MPTDPRFADAAAYPGAAHTPSVYEDQGYGSDAALDAFTGELAEAPPVDPSQLYTHDVTAVLVAHNGGRWLPRTLEAIAALDRLPERIVAVDTGSRDDSAHLLTTALGATAVVDAPAGTGFGAAVEIGVDTADEAVRAGTGMLRPGHAPTAWVWVLHDDSAPAPDALRRLLETAVRNPEAGVIGPKVLGWRDERQLLEVGLTITGGGRRHTSLDKREYDQGQHDTTREVLAVGSAGMLVRRDVWDTLEGFDPHLSIFRDDIDFGWRANTAGYSVVVSPEAAIYHAEAAAHGRRRLGATRDRPHLADRRNAVYVLLANTPGRSLVLTLLRVLFGGLARALGFLVGKQPALAIEELLAVLSVVGRPDRLIRARLRRRRIRQASTTDLRRLFPPRGQQLRHASETVLGFLTGSSSGHDVPGSSRRASTGDEDDDLPEADDTFLVRLLLNPAVLLVTGLVVVTLLAIRGLIGAGLLTGGALLPAPDSTAALWQTYTTSWHGVGLGSPTAAPPYLAVVALLGTLVTSAGLAVDLLLLASVPLAGITAYLLVRRLVASRLLRVWAAAAYALLPATTGAIAGGRLGTAVAAVLTPLVVLAVMRTLGRPGSPGPFRAAWSAALLLALTTAFVPLAWVIALILGGIALATVFRERAFALRILAVVAVAPIVLLPWTGTVIRTPMLLVTEAGAPGPGLSDSALAAWAVLLQNPGGPGAGPIWLGVGVVLAGWAALLRRDRRGAIAMAWIVAGVALVLGVVVSRIPVTGPSLETPVSGWPGYPTVLLGGGLLAAAAIGAEGARKRLSDASFGWRQPLAVVLVVAAVATPVAGSVWWVARGADDPIDRRNASVLPAYVADEAQRPARVRTLVLGKGDDGRITYALLRSSGPRLGDAETGPPAGRYGPLDDAVADLVSGRGGADGARLAAFATKFVYLPKPFDADLADILDTVPGLVRSSAPEGAAMWRVDPPLGRVWVGEPGADGGPLAPSVASDGAPVTVPSDDVEAKGRVPDGAEARTIVVAELADPGWSMLLDGEPLEPETVDGWAQGFTVGASGGDVELTHRGGRRAMWLWLQLAAVLAAVVLALPGMRRERGAVDDAADIDPDEPTSPELPRLPVLAGAPARAVEEPLPPRREPATSAPWAVGAAQPGSVTDPDTQVTRPVRTGPPANPFARADESLDRVGDGLAEALARFPDEPADQPGTDAPASDVSAAEGADNAGQPRGGRRRRKGGASGSEGGDEPARPSGARYKGRRAAGKRGAGKATGRRSRDRRGNDDGGEEG